MAKKSNESAEKSQKSVRDRMILIATAVIMAPILFVIIQNLRHSVSIIGKIRELEHEAVGYQKQISEDSLLLEKIKFDEGLEQYARETFFMQRSGERVFIIEN
ncbi:MAG: septum formation initiator [Rikenellaceae bacterium]